LEPIDYLRIFRRRWATIALVCVLGGLIAYVTTPVKGSHSRTLSYQATTTLLLNPNAPANTPSLAQSVLLLTTGDVPSLAAKQLNYTGNPAALASQVTGKTDPTVNDLQITATKNSAAGASQLADAFATAIINSLLNQATSSYQQQITTVERRINDLTSQINVLDQKIGPLTADQDPVDSAQRSALINQYSLVYDQFQQLAAQGAPQTAFTVLQKAVATPVTDNSFKAPSSRLARLAIGLFAGLVLGAGLILLLDRLDLRIRTKEQAEEYFGYPVIAEIPALPRRRRRRKELQTVLRPGSPFAESHRILRTLLLLSRSAPVANGNGAAHYRAPDPHLILVISAGPSEGKTTTVAHLAVAFAEAGRSVLILSCDFRRPRVHQMFGMPEGKGLTDVLSTDGLRLTDVVQQTPVRGVSLVHSGSFVANPAELIGADHQFLDDARKLADIVLIDTAPALVANDASEVMPEADAVVVVARAGKVTRGAAQRASALLNRVGAKVVGIVLTAAPEAPTNRRYYYYRYYLRQDGLLGWRRLLRRSRHEETGTPVRVEPRARAEVAAQNRSVSGPAEQGSEPASTVTQQESSPTPVMTPAQPLALVIDEPHAAVPTHGDRDAVGRPAEPGPAIDTLVGPVSSPLPDSPIVEDGVPISETTADSPAGGSPDGLPMRSAPVGAPAEEQWQGGGLPRPPCQERERER
jgi:capsular exopolysaccharide synthesis family protein